MEDTDYDWENEQQLNGLPMDQNDGEQQLNGLSASTSGTLEQGSGGASSPVESADAEGKCHWKIDVWITANDEQKSTTMIRWSCHERSSRTSSTSCS